MNKHQYLSELRDGLDGLSYQEIDSIMFDYQSHFEDGLRDGQSEEEISRFLGNPSQVAKELRVTHHISYAEKHPSSSNTIRAIISVIGLSMFNLFVLLIPLIIIFAVLFSLAVTALALVVSPLFLLLDLIVNGTSAVNWFELFMTLFMVGLGFLIIAVVTKLVTLFNQWLVRYIKYNVKIVKGGALT